MTPADAAELLALAAAFDRRRIGESDAIAWADALRGLEPADCAEAIREHFRTTTDYLMPVHVRVGVKRMLLERVRSVPSDELEPDDVDPRNVVAYLEAGRRRRRALLAGHQLRHPSQLQPQRDVQGLLEDTLARLPQVSGGDESGE